MVVTRKTPMVPAPPTSRTNSSQPLIRSKEKEAVKASHSKLSANGGSKGPEDLASPAGGDLSSIHKTAHHFRFKRHQKSERPYYSFRDMLSGLCLLFFAAYTLSVCPYDTNHEVPVCRAISQYRRHVLDPYLVTPFRVALEHPSVAPHVARAVPYVIKVQKVTSPILYRTRREWNRRVIPQWNKRIVPQWKRYAVPRLQQLDRQIEPYRERVLTVYYTRVLPPLNRSYVILNRAKRQAEPQIAYALAKTTDGYYFAKFYWIPVWNQIKVFSHRMLGNLRYQRQLFVDPHVARMWEKVVELGSGRQFKTDEVPIQASTNLSDRAVFDEKSTAVEKDRPSPSISSPIVVLNPSTTHSSGAAPTALSTILETLNSASSVVSASASGVSREAAPIIEEIRSSAEEVQASHVPTAPTQQIEEEELDEDLVGLVMELEADDEPAGDESAEPVEIPPSEEEVAEKERIRLEQVAARRADIEGRHTQWEEKMDEKIKELKQQYLQRLKVSREAAAQELQDATEIRSKVDAFIADAQKYLRLCETYFKKLKQSMEKDKLTLWKTRMDKVEKKFQQRLEAVETDVRDWYTGIINKEIESGQNDAASLQQIADRGQEDLGMDYAWLDDVTVDDWTRYHDLMRRVWNFTDWFSVIQNGTHVESPDNPILPALKLLQTELLEVAEGFMYHLTKVVREGMRTFRAARDEPEEQQVSILPIPTDQVEGDDRIVWDPTLGRSQQEVLEALSRAEQGEKEHRRAKARARREEL